MSRSFCYCRQLESTIITFFFVNLFVKLSKHLFTSGEYCMHAHWGQQLHVHVVTQQALFAWHCAPVLVRCALSHCGLTVRFYWNMYVFGCWNNTYPCDWHSYTIFKSVIACNAIKRKRQVLNSWADFSYWGSGLYGFQPWNLWIIPTKVMLGRFCELDQDFKLAISNKMLNPFSSMFLANIEGKKCWNRFQCIKELRVWYLFLRAFLF